MEPAGTYIPDVAVHIVVTGPSIFSYQVCMKIKGDNGKWLLVRTFDVECEARHFAESIRDVLRGKNWEKE